MTDRPQGLSATCPRLRWRPLLYRTILRITRRRGLFSIARRHFPLFPDGQIVSLPVGGRLFIPPDSHFVGFLTGLHEEHISRLLKKIVTPGSLCIDVGANIGYFSVMMSALAQQQGLVIAFEPDPENFSTLSENASLTPEGSAAIEARNQAISDVIGTVTLLEGGERTLHTISKDQFSSPASRRVEAITLDSIFSELKGRSIRILKIDVEGHELYVLKGAKNLLAKARVENLVIEVTPGREAEDLEALIRPYASSLSVWIEGAWVEMPLRLLSNRTDVWVKF